MSSPRPTGEEKRVSGFVNGQLSGAGVLDSVLSDRPSLPGGTDLGVNQRSHRGIGSVSVGLAVTPASYPSHVTHPEDPRGLAR